MENEASYPNSSFSPTHPFLQIYQYDWKSFGFQQSSDLSALVCTVVIILVTVIFTRRLIAGTFTTSRGLVNARRVLFVTAHPDDECMFFGPTLIQLTRQASVHLLCLTPGNFYGQGSTRKRELWSSCRSLGLNPNNLTLVKHTLLPDDPKLFWPTSLVASLIDHQVETLNIDTIVAFDRYGVSGHRNHISIYRALLKLCGDYEMYTVQTVSLFRKYIGCLALPFSIRTPEIVYISSSKERTVIREAMTKHASQYVWFRKLYMTFSCYIYFNSLNRISR